MSDGSSEELPWSELPDDEVVSFRLGCERLPDDAEGDIAGRCDRGVAVK